MRVGLYHYAFLFWFLIFQGDTYCQIKRIREYKSDFQLSLFPGISTNGVYSGSYHNNYSFNLFGGLSAGNRILEIGLVSNVNLKSTTGIQIAGLANVIGANAFVNLTLPEERSLIHEGFESNSTGIQLAGFLNYVRNNVRGIQFAGGLNVVGYDFRGIQLAGIGNSAGESAIGLQVAGVYNLAFEAMAGLQISALFNYTEGELAGLQLALINKAMRIKGRNSTPPTPRRGLQVGLLNFSRSMEGMQIGLINFGGAIRGKQIGLVNFFVKTPSKEHVQNGTPVGLLNFGSKGSVSRVYYNELFPTNIEYTTGNCQNCSWTPTEMPIITGKHKTFNQNALILGYDPFQDTWGFGYGFMKILYNKASVAPNPANEKRMLSYGIRFIHLNRELKFDKRFNLVNRLHFDYGFRIRSVYVFLGASVNYFLQEEDYDEYIYPIQSLVISSGELLGLKTSFWPGYMLGIQF